MHLGQSTLVNPIENYVPYGRGHYFYKSESSSSRDALC